MSEGVPAELRAKTPGRMQSVERRGPGERDISLAQPLELPLELIQLILKQVDSLRTLVIASSVCRAFQHEAECLLYRTVHVCQVPQIRSLHHALTQFPMRASFVHTFELEGEWLELQGVVPHLSRILLLLTHLDVLKLSSTAFFTDWDFCVAMLSTLAKCPFRLRSFTSRVFYSPELLRFLGQQTGLESLHVADLSYYVYSDDGAISPTILPNVKYLRTDHTFFLRTITTAHAITHLDLNLTDRDHQPLDAVLKILEHQLISLKCNLFSFHLRRPAGCILSDLINQRPMPNLRYLEVKDVLPSLVLEPLSAVDYMHMGSQNTALGTLVWSASFGRAESTAHDNRLTYIRPWAKEVLNRYSSLRRVFYAEEDEVDGHMKIVFATRFMLSPYDRTLLEERTEAKDLPLWSDI